MSSLLARFAENLYWLGRYLERAENTARILHINQTYARDNVEGPDWRRVLDLYDDTDRFFEAHEHADARSVLNWYVIDRDNPTSIAFAVANARENARTVRHLISTEMWIQVNLFHGTMKSMTARNITLSNLSNLASHLILQCQTFDGIADGTFLRGEPCCFYQIGKYLERADQTTRVLDMGYDRLSVREPDAVASVQWSTMLRSVSGYHAYRSRHPAASRPSDIAGFLLYDTEFPRAVALCVQRVTERLRDQERRHGTGRSEKLEAARREVEFALDTGPGSDLSSERLHNFLDKVQISLAGVSNAIANAYFAYH